jgi:hypothetical protein
MDHRRNRAGRPRFHFLPGRSGGSAKVSLLDGSQVDRLAETRSYSIVERRAIRRKWIRTPRVEIRAVERVQECWIGSNTFAGSSKSGLLRRN